MVSQLTDGSELRCWNSVRGWVHVEDVARAMTFAALHCSSGTYTVCACNEELSSVYAMAASVMIDPSARNVPPVRRLAKVFLTASNVDLFNDASLRKWAALCSAHGIKCP